MSKTYALRKLLEHGPMTYAELLEVTGWSHPALKSALARTIERGEVQPIPGYSRRGYGYRAA